MHRVPAAGRGILWWLLQQKRFCIGCLECSAAGIWEVSNDQQGLDCLSQCRMAEACVSLQAQAIWSILRGSLHSFLINFSHLISLYNLLNSSMYSVVELSCTYLFPFLSLLLDTSVKYRNIIVGSSEPLQCNQLRSGQRQGDTLIDDRGTCSVFNMFTQESANMNVHTNLCIQVGATKLSPLSCAH